MVCFNQSALVKTLLRLPRYFQITRKVPVVLPAALRRRKVHDKNPLIGLNDFVCCSSLIGPVVTGDWTSLSLSRHAERRSSTLQLKLPTSSRRPFKLCWLRGLEMTARLHNSFHWCRRFIAERFLWQKWLLFFFLPKKEPCYVALCEHVVFSMRRWGRSKVLQSSCARKPVHFIQWRLWSGVFWWKTDEKNEWIMRISRRAKVHWQKFALERLPDIIGVSNVTFTFKKNHRLRHSTLYDMCRMWAQAHRELLPVVADRRQGDLMVARSSCGHGN